MIFTSPDLRGALKLLDGGRSWTKGAYWSPDGTKFCSLGAVMEVGAWQSAGIVKILNDVAKEQFPDRIDGTVRKHVAAQVNDHLDTTWPDVERLFEKAILKAEEVL